LKALKKFVYCGSEVLLRENKERLDSQGFIEALNNDPSPGHYYIGVLSRNEVIGRKEWLLKIHYQKS